MGKENFCEAGHKFCSHRESECSRTNSCDSIDKDDGAETCRICQCTQTDKRGDTVMGYLGISPPLQGTDKCDGEVKPNSKEVLKDIENDDSLTKNCKREHGSIEVISPDGEIFICNADIEMGSCMHQDTLIELGCSCKNDLALVHYSCALKWFINHGSSVCEICGCIAKNVKISDLKKILCALKDFEALREQTTSGEPTPILSLPVLLSNPGVDPDAVAAIRRLRLSEISRWFSPHIPNSSLISQDFPEQPSTVAITGDAVLTENHATRWAVEGTGILVATGLLTVTIAWLIAPRVGKKTAKSGLHILLGGICALTVVVFFRFFVLTRIKYGPARYWAILFVFWFLVFGIWASRTHVAHTP